MHRIGVGFDRYTFVSVLSLCDLAELVGFGRQVHSMVIRTGFLEFSVAAVSALVMMYFDCEVVRDGVGVFRESRVCDVITCDNLIAGLVRWERDEDALMVFEELIREAFLRPTEMTYISVLSACSLKEIGEQVYGQVIEIGLEDSLLVGNVAVTMYSGCGDLVSARQVFERIYDRMLYLGIL
nr:pentatricopeptide repeat protein AaPPR912 [Agave angustifolia]